MSGVCNQLGAARAKKSYFGPSHSDGTLPGRAPLAWRVMWLCHMDGATMHCFLNLESPEEEAWCEVEEGPEEVWCEVEVGPE